MKKLILFCMIICCLCLAGCASESFAEDVFLEELERAVAAQEPMITFSCAYDDALAERIDAALTDAYDVYLIGENVENIAWDVRKLFGSAKITLEPEYHETFVDDRAQAVEYAALAEKAEQAVRAREESLSLLFHDDGSVTDMDAELDRVLFGGESAVLSYYLSRAEYSIRTYREYVAVTLRFEYASEDAFPESPADEAEAIESTIRQWDAGKTALLYLPEAPADPEAYCRTILTTANANDADFAYNCETYYWNAYGTRDCIVSLERRCEYDAEKLEALRQELTAAAQQLADSIAATDGQTAVKQIAAALCDAVRYDDPLAASILSEHALSDASNIRRTAYGALVEGASVCTGYAKAFQLICDLKGIPCCTIDGFVDDVGHEWNMVFLDGVRYYVDVTFADTSRNTAFYLFDDALYEKEGYEVEGDFYIPAA